MDFLSEKKKTPPSEKNVDRLTDDDTTQQHPGRGTTSFVRILPTPNNTSSQRISETPPVEEISRDDRNNKNEAEENTNKEEGADDDLMSVDLEAAVAAVASKGSDAQQNIDSEHQESKFKLSILESFCFPFMKLSSPATLTDSAVFATRMAITMGLSALVVLLPPIVSDTSAPWPEAAWVYITAGIVSWQPGPDTAPVFKKLVERILGTICGAILGLGVGFLSVLVANAASSSSLNDEERNHEYLQAQAIFLALALPCVVFIGAFVVTQAGYRDSYISTLTNLTTGLVVLAFFGVEEDMADGRPPWMHGLFRVLNILIGCVIAGSVTSVVRPVATHRQLECKVKKLSNLTGASVRAVLNATIEVTKEGQRQKDDESKNTPTMNHPDSNASTTINSNKGVDRPYYYLPTITDLVRDPEHNISDQAHDSYIASIDLWRDCRQSLQLLRYDPVFQSKFNKRQQRLFREHMRLRLARLFRIQVVIVMLDSLLRGGLHQGGGDGGGNGRRRSTTQNALEVLETIGQRVEVLLDTTSNKNEQERNEVARKLIQEDIVKVRRLARMLQQESSTSFLTTTPGTSFSSSDPESQQQQQQQQLLVDEEEEEINGDALWSILGNFDHPFPLSSLKGPGQSSLFYRLLEHVILKAVRLYHVNESFEKELSS